MVNSVFNLTYSQLQIAESVQTFPVRRIYCVGQNYTAHTIEMGGDPTRDAPFFFSKPSDAVCQIDNIPWPGRTSNLHHEVELVVAIGKAGTDMTLEQANDAIYAYAVGVDLTRRDLQQQAKEKGRPWDTAKGFDFSAPVGELLLAENWQPEKDKTIKILINGEEKQTSSLDQLIWSVPELIKELSTYYRLQPGDLIFTGTPSGVGPISRGDSILAMVNGLPELSFTIGEKEL
ncbi:MAG: fumarylpyruvate hydrolase [Enterobacterales bacterium]|jgi:fumarylpyruvate hydrolase